ncbi:hypothetical protein [Nonomuraea sp. NPDC023979]|uniref:hypothetical protein n=1 Tax=Nonomuraea sp. NPDC023979 TaxID=3154796 RepID=UPI0033E650A9
MNLRLGLALYATDVTACSRCTNSFELQHMFRTLDGTHICLRCIDEAVEAHRLGMAAGRDIADHEIPF